jgi:hypothetical protein
MKRLCVLAMLVFCAATSAMAQAQSGSLSISDTSNFLTVPVAVDGLDLHRVTVHDSPADIADWPVTVSITTLTMQPLGESPEGLAFETSTIPQAWDYHVPGWGTGTTCPADGCVFYTVHAVAFVNGGWHEAGFIQMWQGRVSTGAPILTDFHKNWAYAKDRWGDLNDYLPQVGDQMGFFLSAGNARDVREVTSRRERSNVVLVKLPAGDRGVFTFSGVTPPQPDPTPTPAPTPGVPGPPGPVGPQGPKGDPGDAADLSGILARLAALEGRLQVLESHPVPVSCTAAVNLGATRIPISCRLNP